MIILDALVACLIFKIFGVNGLYCIGITCVISVLRTSVKITNWLNALENYLDNVCENK